MSVQVSIEYKDFKMSAREDKILNYGKHLLTALIVYLYAPLSMRKYCACMEDYRQN